MEIQVTVNGTVYHRDVEPRLLLSDFLRHELKLTGTHVGCEHGSCGACTVLLRTSNQAAAPLSAAEYDIPVRSCIMFAVQAHGHAITTVEGLGDPQKLHPLQQAFWEKHGLQCGYCTPGFLLTLIPFLRENPNPSEAQIRDAISGNICRCTGYQNIVDAALLAAELLQQE
ncbi:MAG: (2Fe-2S)-binding protein [Caldilineaceae bacterium]